MTPPGVRNEWTVGYIVNLQDSIVDRLRGTGAISYPSPSMVCVAPNVRGWVGYQGGQLAGRKLIGTLSAGFWPTMFRGLFVAGLA